MPRLVHLHTFAFDRDGIFGVCRCDAEIERRSRHQQPRNTLEGPTRYRLSRRGVRRSESMHKTVATRREWGPLLPRSPGIRRPGEAELVHRRNPSRPGVFPAGHPTRDARP